MCARRRGFTVESFIRSKSLSNFFPRSHSPAGSRVKPQERPAILEEPKKKELKRKIRGQKKRKYRQRFVKVRESFPLCSLGFRSSAKESFRA